MSQFVGASIQTQQGQSLGDVQDVVVNKQGQPLYLVLSGSEFNKQNQMVAVPWQAASPQFRNGNIIINLSKQQLSDAPAFPEDNWAELEQNQQQINAYFGSHGAQMGGQQQGQVKTQPQGQQPLTQQQ